MEQLPFDLLILDTKLRVTYANPGAVRSSGTTGGVFGVLGAGQSDAVERPARGGIPSRLWRAAIYHDDAVGKVPGLTSQGRCFELDVLSAQGTVRHRRDWSFHRPR